MSSEPLDLLTDPNIPVPKGDEFAGDGAMLRESRLELSEALRSLPEGPVSKAVLRDKGLDTDLCSNRAKLEWRRIVTDGPWRERHTNRTIRPFARLWHEIENALSADGDQCGNLTIMRTEEGAKAVRVTGRAKVSKDLRAPTLLIDAKLDSELVKPFWPQAIFESPIDISAPHQRIRQAVGKSFAKTYLTNRKDEDPAQAKSRAKAQRKLRAVIMREVRRAGGKAGVISNKSIIEALALPKHVPTLHFNATAGRDHWRDLKLLIVVGRPQPRPEVVERMAAALTGAPPTVSLDGGWYPRVDTTRLVGSAQEPTTVVRHPDEMTERLRALICAGEIEQAIGRARGVGRTADNPVEVIVLSDVILDMAVNDLLADDWLTPTADDMQLAEGGVSFADGTAMSAAYPHLWPTAGAARFARHQEQSSVRSSIEYSSIENLTLLYQRAMNGAKPQIAVFDPAMCSDPKAAIEGVVGDLAAFSIGVPEEVVVPIAQAAPALAFGEQLGAVQIGTQKDRRGDFIIELAERREGAIIVPFCQPDGDLRLVEIAAQAAEIISLDAIDPASQFQVFDFKDLGTRRSDDGERSCWGEILTAPSAPKQKRPKRQAKKREELAGEDMSWLAQTLNDASITRTEFAQRAGLSPSHLRNIETGHRKASQEQMEAIKRTAASLITMQGRLL